MKKKGYGPYSLGILILLGTFATPAFGEVVDLQTDQESFFKGDKIEFSGNVESESTGLVTIVIRDLNDEFVLLTQATINHDNTFEKSVIIENRFTEHGTYSATGFILNMTKGITTGFDVSIDGTSIVPDIKTELENKIDESDIEEVVGAVPSSVKIFESSKNTTVQEIISNEIIPEAQASSVVTPIEPTTNNSDIAQISLAMTGLAILFGAVYGVKRQVDNNSKQISINKDTIRKKIIKPIMRSSPYDILQIRLAKGEITLEEFDILEKKLK